MVDEEEVLDVDDWHDATKDEFEAGSVMTQKTGLIDYKLDDGGVRFTDVTNMPEKKEKAETSTTVHREHVPEAIAGQDDADQEGRDDHVAKANPDNGDEATKLTDVDIQTRPKKPPDAGYLKLKRVGPGLLKTGILLMHIMLMMNPMIIVSGPVLMNTYGDDNRLHEEEFVYTERGTMGDMGVASMKTELCPCAALGLQE